LATAPDPRRRYPGLAIHLARQVCQASEERQPEYLETLALAYAAAGKMAEAADAARRASALSTPQVEMVRGLAGSPRR
jgi:hypothetical protein